MSGRMSLNSAALVWALLALSATILAVLLDIDRLDNAVWSALVISSVYSVGARLERSGGP